MNPKTNKFEPLLIQSSYQKYTDRAKHDLSSIQLCKANGEPVPKHWSIFSVGEKVVIKDYTFAVAYINDSTIIFEPLGPVIIGEEESF